jgi:hypothetical protein
MRATKVIAASWQICFRRGESLKSKMRLGWPCGVKATETVYGYGVVHPPLQLRHGVGLQTFLSLVLGTLIGRIKCSLPLRRDIIERGFGGQRRRRNYKGKGGLK